MKNYWNSKWEKNAKAHAEETFTLSVLSTTLGKATYMKCMPKKKSWTYKSAVSEQLIMA